MRDQSGKKFREIIEELRIENNDLEGNRDNRISKYSKWEKENLKKELPDEFLNPILDKETKFLILGEGALENGKSLERGKYYQDGNNDFWRIMHELVEDVSGEKSSGDNRNFNEIYNQNYVENIQSLKQHKIGLWDYYPLKAKLRGDYKKLDKYLKNLREIWTNGKFGNDVKNDLKSKFKHIKVIVLYSSSARMKVEKKKEMLEK